ncbi:HdeD family acid-resistance protein [Psychrobacter sp. I-STPA6b]|uniref:HdeD family acid-resistance protein n=1 Tax=Psychrobacter sp. I-STPA6b TaxID=2585718 RepID=UPI001D0C50F9|nr:DUF308 domain-containing protein [Psychrobacter sp. I-STPA6b]
MNRTLWVIIGIISILGGTFALFNPLSASLAAEQIAGWIFLFVGILQLFTIFQVSSTSARIFTGLGGAVSTLIGLELLQEPLKGILALTLVIAFLFILTGSIKSFVAFSLRNTPAFAPMLFSGIISIILAVMIFTNFPQSATFILGILLAVELISNGLTLLMFSRNQTA